jgi:hypothetical protein
MDIKKTDAEITVWYESEKLKCKASVDAAVTAGILLSEDVGIDGNIDTMVGKLLEAIGTDYVRGYMALAVALSYLEAERVEQFGEDDPLVIVAGDISWNGMMMRDALVCS